MKRDFFINLEDKNNQHLPLNEVVEQLAFDSQGLIPVIVQDATSMQVLMFAWMNKATLMQTIETKRMTYWSRSRQQIWIKGETSGHTQHVKSVSIDCDGDAVLCLVDQMGAACHTGRKDCFYLNVNEDGDSIHIEGKARLDF